MHFQTIYIIYMHKFCELQAEYSRPSINISNFLRKIFLSKHKYFELPKNIFVSKHKYCELTRKIFVSKHKFFKLFKPIHACEISMGSFQT